MDNKWKTLSIVLIVAFSIHYWHNSKQQNAPQQQSIKEEKKLPVVVQTAQIRHFQDSIKLNGNVKAKNSAHISPKLPGILTAIHVEEGDIVTKDQTPLFQSEKLKFQKAFEIAEQDLKLAKCNLSVSQANLQKVGADYHKAHIDYQRFQRLFKEQAITPNQMEQQESRYLQTKAALKQVQALLRLSEEQQTQAQAAYEIAQKDLQDTLIKSPIDGIITQKNNDPGEMGKVGETVLIIQDLDTIEISAFVPSEHYLQVSPKETQVIIKDQGGIEIQRAPITYKSPTIHHSLRTFEIKIQLPNPDRQYVPGMLLDLEIIFEKHQSLGVPHSSIMEKQKGPSLYLAQDGKAKLTQVQTGLRTNGWIEIKSKNIQEKDLIITQGQFILKQGQAISIQEGAKQ